jgi:hypothetical protein
VKLIRRQLGRLTGIKKPTMALRRNVDGFWSKARGRTISCSPRSTEAPPDRRTATSSFPVSNMDCAASYWVGSRCAQIMSLIHTLKHSTLTYELSGQKTYREVGVMCPYCKLTSFIKLKRPLTTRASSSGSRELEESPTKRRQIA